MHSNLNTDSPDGSTWDPDPQGLIEFELWEEYKAKVDTFHAEWVRNDPTRKSGYVYVMAMLGAGPSSAGMQTVKIGRSRTPRLRLKEVQKSSVIMPYRIELWDTFWSPDMKRAERLMHMLLQRYRTHGEWFDLPSDIWGSFDALWYIEPYHSLTELEFRDGYNGGWYTPQAFFEHQIHRHGES